MKLDQALEKASLRREALHGDIQVYRLFDGVADGLASLYIDRYHTVAVAHYLPEEDDDSKEIVAALTKSKDLFIKNGVTSFYFRSHAKDPRESKEVGSKLLFGEAVAELWVQDAGLSFKILPEGSLHAGLYVDMREVRAELVKASPGKRVLNAFCFTGSLGIAAARGGATEICQVDSSPAVLEWAKENWAKNSEGFEGEMRFICDDCILFLDRERRRVQERGGKPTDLALIDPPSFGRSRKRVFSFKNDVEKLCELVFGIMAPNGWVYLSTNNRKFSPATLEKAVYHAAESAGKKIKEVSPLLPPSIDFPSQGAASIAMRGVKVQLA